MSEDLIGKDQSPTGQNNFTEYSFSSVENKKMQLEQKRNYQDHLNSSLASCADAPLWSHRVVSSDSFVSFADEAAGSTKRGIPAVETKRGFLDSVGNFFKSAYTKTTSFIRGSSKNEADLPQSATSVSSTEHVIGKIINLNITDGHVDHCQAKIDALIARGPEHDTSLLMRLISIANRYNHNKDHGTDRLEQKRHSSWIEENHPEFVNMKKNERTQFLHGLAGSVGLVGTGFTVSIFVFAAVTGASPEVIDGLIKAPQLVFDGLSRGIGKMGEASATGDQARYMALEYMIQVLQREIQESQSRQQNGRGNETEALRQLKEILEAERNHIASVLRALAAPTT